MAAARDYRPKRRNAMKTLKTRLALPAALLAAAAIAPGAAVAAGEVIPPGNSAATQYTEAFPTPGGDKKTDEAAHHRSPVKVPGNSNANKLRQQGPDGQAAAETAAATAPVATETPPAPTNESPDENSAGGGSTAGAGSGNGGNGPAGQKHQPNSGDTAGAQVAVVEVPEGSSGIGSAIEQATGLSTSGQSGMLLPLVILATIALSIAYLWRQRRQVD
jgi:hypothetical protein